MLKVSFGIIEYLSAVEIPLSGFAIQTLDYLIIDSLIVVSPDVSTEILIEGQLYFLIP